MTTAFQNYKTLYLNLPQSWKRTYIKYCNFKLGSGKTPSGGSAVYLDAGIALIRSLNVYDDGLRAEGLVYIDENTNYEMANTRLKENDVLLNITGASIGRSCIVPRWVLPANVNQHVCIIRPTKDVLSQYLAYVFKSAPIKDQINAYQQGSSREGLNFAQVGDLAFLLPPIPIQHQIASFLDRKTAAIDTLITKKQRLIQLLEEKRTALINQAVTKGLNPNVPMKDSGISWIGKIPEQWLKTSIKRVCSSVRDGTHNPPPRVEGKYRLLSARNIQNGEFILRDDDRLMDADAFAELERSYTVRQGDVVIAVVGATTGKSAVVGTLEKVSVQRSIAILRPKQTIINSNYLNFWISSTGTQHEIGLTYSKYSAQGGIYLDDLANLTCILPPSNEQTKILNFLDKAFASILITERKLSEQIKKLQEYRQSLITAAVTGKIDIREEVAA